MQNAECRMQNAGVCDLVAYPLCNQTVTRYRKVGDAVERRVLNGCFYRYSDHADEEQFLRKFLLICPGAEAIRPGDRVFDGIGPEQVQWETFLPVNVPGLSEAAYAAPWHWQGEIAHWEAGRK